VFFSDPATSLEIKTPLFEGPLDLLLILIRKQKVEIADIQLSDLTASYLECLQTMRSLDLDIAGEFLDIAATLILIKSRRLLPSVPNEAEENIEENPEEVLRQRLIEYQHFKDAAFQLNILDQLGRDEFVRTHGEMEQEEQKEEEKKQSVLAKPSVYALMAAFQKVMLKRNKAQATHVVKAESHHMEQRLKELKSCFLQNSHCVFEELFEGAPTHALLIFTFIALLEMVKRNLITILQVERFGSIHCVATKNFEQDFEHFYQSVL